MKCTVCGAQLRSAHSDLPFKVSEQTIVIVKQLPVLQCESCAQYLLEDRVLSRVDGRTALALTQRLEAQSSRPQHLHVVRDF